MDYRLESIRVSAQNTADYCTRRAEQFRAEARGQDEPNHAMEISIATEVGKAAGYQWAADQMATFEVPAAGSGLPAATEAPRASGVDCSSCHMTARQALSAFEALCSEADGYGWKDSDAQRYKERLGQRLRDLVASLGEHS